MPPSWSDFARALLARIRSREADLDDPFVDTTEWLLLPLAKQEVASRRLDALRKYDALIDPNSMDALAAAKSMGVAIARFYQLLAHWRQADRTLRSLVPHQALGAERESRLATKETAVAVREAIARVLDREPLATTGRVIAQVRRGWRGPGDLPSDTALRSFHDRALQSIHPTPGTLTLNFGTQPQEVDVVAERFAETLVIDHVSTKGLVADEDGLPPTVTLAIDLWSGAPLGAAVLASDPGPAGVAIALDQASRRLLASQGKGESVRQLRAAAPRLVLATTFDPEWGRLRDTLLAAGYDLVERQDKSLHQGGPARRLLGARLGDIALDRRAKRTDPFGFDPRSTAIQPLHVIERLVRQGLEELAIRRMPAEALEAAVPFYASGLVKVFPPAANSAPKPIRRPIRAGKPSQAGPADLPALLGRLARTRTPGGPKALDVRRTDDGVWHLDVQVAEEEERDAAFLALAQGAMEISERRHVPIVVHVGIAHEPGV